MPLLTGAPTLSVAEKLKELGRGPPLPLYQLFMDKPRPTDCVASLTPQPRSCPVAVPGRLLGQVFDITKGPELGTA